MRRSGSESGISQAVAAFQAEVQRLAYAAVRTVIEEELARRRARPERRAKPARARPARRKREPPQVRQLELGFARPSEHQLELPLAPSAARDAAPPPEPAASGGIDTVVAHAMAMKSS